MTAAHTLAQFASAVETLRWRPFSVDGPEELLSAFVGTWERDRQFGYRLDLCRGEFPALTARQAQAVEAIASDRYWRARLCNGSLERSKECLEAIAGAVEAATAEHRASKGKPSRSDRLVRILRERDGDACWVCQHELGSESTIEHKVARANGGTWAINNLALAHRECNQSLGRLPLAAKEAVRAALADRSTCGIEIERSRTGGEND